MHRNKQDGIKEGDIEYTKEVLFESIVKDGFFLSDQNIVEQFVEESPEIVNEVRLYYQDYDIPITKEDRYTEMDVLKYIYDNLDTLLSFYSHSVYNHGICERCTMKIDGKIKLACTYLVEDSELTIEPKVNKVVKDLVTR